MRQVWRDQENVARAHDDFLTVDDEIQRTFNHVADLLVNVVMHGNVRALLQDDAREHDVGSYNILARDQTIQLFRLDVGPAMVLAPLHGASFAG